eukprot:767636-Hanusia_phi.AAC.1
MAISDSNSPSMIRVRVAGSDAVIGRYGTSSHRLAARLNQVEIIVSHMLGDWISILRCSAGHMESDRRLEERVTVLLLFTRSLCSRCGLKGTV